MTSPPPPLPDLRYGAVVAEWARCASLHVEAISMGGATLLLCPELPRFVGFNRALDVDARQTGLVEALIDKARQAGRRPVLEILAETLDDARRDDLLRLGLQKRGTMAVLDAGLDAIGVAPLGDVIVRDVRPDEAERFGALAVRAYGIAEKDRADHERVWTGCARSGIARCFFAEVDGEPGAMSMLYALGDTVFVDGAATLPEHRRRGCQGALLDHRLRVAREIEGARFAVTRTLEGSNSQRNVERKGLRVFRRLEVWGVSEGQRSAGPADAGQ